MLCGPLEGELWRSRYWRAVLNRNQNLLGKTMLVLDRHVIRVVDLSPEEWVELREQVVDVTFRLDAAFAPDHYNYCFLQNADRHVHLHVIPRYAGRRELAGAEFGDPDYPGHYMVPMPDRTLPGEVTAAITAALGV